MSWSTVISVYNRDVVCIKYNNVYETLLRKKDLDIPNSKFPAIPLNVKVHLFQVELAERKK